MDKGTIIKVLDHGYVKLIDYMGSDEAIVEAARMSTGRGFISWERYSRCKKCDKVYIGTEHIGPVGECEHNWQDFPRGDLGMLDFMYRNKHSTPFEFSELHIEVQAPIMVFREWHRHRTQSYSEFSARYSQMPNLHYLPEVGRFQKQGVSNRQGSSGEIVEHAEILRSNIEIEQVHIYDNYEEMIRLGVSKEVARLDTPVSRYSKMRAKANLRNWLGFMLLRVAPNAQWEIRQFANAVAEIVKSLWPRTYALFEEYDLYSLTLSRSEVQVLRSMLEGREFWLNYVSDVLGVDVEQLKTMVKKLGIEA